ncbi:MAG: ABC transporter permease [Pseudomonadota bacterium]
MVRYDFRLAWHSMRRNPVLTLLMIAAIGVGVGAFMTALNVYHVSSKNPIAHKNDQLYHVQLDSFRVGPNWQEGREPPDQISYTDAMNLLRDGSGLRQSASFKTGFGIATDDYTGLPIRALGRATSPDFFEMFEVPFVYGGTWEQAAHDTAPQAVVLSRAMSERLFGEGDSVGESVLLDDEYYSVVGVIDDWSPSPKFYDLTNGSWLEAEDVFVPFALVPQHEYDTWGNTRCNGDGDVDTYAEFLQSSCVWISYWVELASGNERDDFVSYLNAYVEDQRTSGRFEAPNNFRFRTVEEWLIEEQVATDATKVLLWLSAMFLTVCLLNSIGLVLAKFTSRAPQLALRRAVGASRAALVRQSLVEIVVIGALGGVLGMALAMLGLQGMRILTEASNTSRYEMDWFMMSTAIVVSVLATVAAGLYPALRISSLAPARYLKTQ